MDDKSLATLEYPKVLEKLAYYADISASAELARQLRPTADLPTALDRLAVTREARLLLSINDSVGIGGARDIRTLVSGAARGQVLLPAELLDVKATLISGRELGRSLEHKEAEYPHLHAISVVLSPPPGLIETITRAISDRGEVLDSASPRLASIRAEIKISHERLMTRLTRIINDPKNAPHLQEAIITQRSGRYVIPMRSESRGRIRSIIHDQSSSGATVFVEPLVVVEMNNAYQEAQLAERDEERRILSALSDQVGDYFAEITALVEGLAQLDLALTKGTAG